MIVKLSEGKIFTLGEGVLTDFHKVQGYEEVATNSIQTKEDGSYYAYYNQDYTVDTAKELEVATAKLISDGEALVTNYVQARVDKFNADNGVKFSNIHSVANYKDSATYPLAVQCKALWDWNEKVWVKAREEQANAVTTGMTEAEFIAILDAIV